MNENCKHYIETICGIFYMNFIQSIIMLISEHIIPYHTNKNLTGELLPLHEVRHSLDSDYTYSDYINCTLFLNILGIP